MTANQTARPHLAGRQLRGSGQKVCTVQTLSSHCTNRRNHPSERGGLHRANPLCAFVPEAQELQMAALFTSQYQQHLQRVILEHRHGQ